MPKAPADASFMADTTRTHPADTAQVLERIDAQDQAKAIEQQLGERDITDAALYGIPLDEWKAMSPRAKELVLQNPPSGYVPVGERDFNKLPEVDARSGNMAQLSQQFNRLRDRLISPEEEKEFVYLCDPVKDDPRWGRITPGVSKIRRDPTGQSIAKKIRQRFTYSPIAPFRPEPDVPCGFPGFDKPVCDYYGYADADDPTRSTEVEIHQKAKHPREYEARREAMARAERVAARERDQRQAARDEQQMEFMRLQTELMRQQLEAAKAGKGG